MPVVDATQPVEAIAAEVLSLVQALLPHGNGADAATEEVVS